MDASRGKKRKQPMTLEESNERPAVAELRRVRQGLLNILEFRRGRGDRYGNLTLEEITETLAHIDRALEAEAEANAPFPLDARVRLRRNPEIWGRVTTEGDIVTVYWGTGSTTQLCIHHARKYLEAFPEDAPGEQRPLTGETRSAAASPVIAEYARQVSKQIARRHLIAYGQSFEAVRHDIAKAIEDAVALGEQNALFERRYGPGNYQES
jgi:hypothetical protein